MLFTLFGQTASSSQTALSLTGLFIYICWYQLRHVSLLSVRLFILAYLSTFNSLSISTLFLSVGLLPSILPSSTSFNKPLPRICPIHLFLVLVIISTSSFVFFCPAYFSILLHIHISIASILLISYAFNDHVSDPYIRTLQTTVLIILFHFPSYTSGELFFSSVESWFCHCYS